MYEKARFYLDGLYKRAVDVYIWNDLRGLHAKPAKLYKSPIQLNIIEKGAIRDIRNPA